MIKPDDKYSRFLAMIQQATDRANQEFPDEPDLVIPEQLDQEEEEAHLPKNQLEK